MGLGAAMDDTRKAYTVVRTRGRPAPTDGSMQWRQSQQRTRFINDRLFGSAQVHVSIPSRRLVLSSGIGPFSSETRVTGQRCHHPELDQGRPGSIDGCSMIQGGSFWCGVEGGGKRASSEAHSGGNHMDTTQCPSEAGIAVQCVGMIRRIVIQTLPIPIAAWGAAQTLPSTVAALGYP